MPRPPKDNETKDEYIWEYCVNSKVMKDEYPNRSQRIAVCISYWDRSKNENKGE